MFITRNDMHKRNIYALKLHEIWWRFKELRYLTGFNVSINFFVGNGGLKYSSLDICMWRTYLYVDTYIYEDYKFVVGKLIIDIYGKMDEIYFCYDIYYKSVLYYSHIWAYAVDWETDR